MAWFADLSPCDYFGEFKGIRAIGWLEEGHAFVLGKVDRAVYDKLREFCRDPWTPATLGAMGGVYGCTFCQYEPIIGWQNLFVPGRGVIYACPALITHYMNAHSYAPPQEFCDAVMACPPMRSMDYLKAILANGGRELAA